MKNWSRSILFLLWLSYTVILGALYSRLPPSPDNSVYDYIGWIISQGGTLYIDAADQNWPGIMLVHTLPTLLFGNTIWSFRLFDYLFLLGTCALLFVFIRRYWGTLAGLLVVPIYQAMYVSENIWFAGQRDIVVTPLLIGAAFSLLLRIETNRLIWCIVQGVCLALATFIRPTLLLLTLLLAVGDIILMRQTRRNIKVIVFDHAIAGLSLLALLAILTLIGWQTGALQEWYNVAIRYNLEVYGQDSTSLIGIVTRLSNYALKSWFWYIALSILGILIHWRTKPQPTVFLLAILVNTIASAIVQGKGFEYHLGAILPLLAIFMAPLVATCVQNLFKRPSKPIKTLLAGLVCCLVILGLAKKISNNLNLQIQWYLGKVSTQEMLANYPAGDALNLAQAVELSAYVKQTVPEDRTVLYWGRPMVINYLSGRRSPSRFASFALLDQPRESFSLFKVWEDELKNDLINTPPELIFVEPNVNGEGYQNMPSEKKEARLSNVVLDAIATRYELDKKFGVVDAYRIKR